MSSGQPKSCPLMDLPIEIRLSIIDYLLPRDRDKSRTITLPTRVCHIEHGAGTNTISLGLPKLDPCLLLLAADTSPSRFALRRYLFGIALVSHQLHAEFNEVLHSSTFIVDISEKAFSEQGCAPFRWIYHPTVWEWNQLLPGLDISRVPFCEDLNERMRGGDFRKLTIEITEGQTTEASEPPASLVPASANDFAGIVDTFRRHLGNVQNCEIKLPEWTAGDKELMDLAAETKATVCLPWGATGTEHGIEAIEREDPQVEEAVLESPETESNTTQVQEGALEDTESPPVDEVREQQALGSWPEGSCFKEDLFKKQEHEEWDDWYAAGDCSCSGCLYESEES